MSIKLHIECSSCNAVFKLDHEMDDSRYEATVCPFCGEEYDKENSEEIDVEDYGDE